LFRLTVEEPARIAGLRLPQELTSRLTGDSNTGEAVPLLAFILRQLADGLSRDDRALSRPRCIRGVRAATATAQSPTSPRAADSVAERAIACLVRMVTGDGPVGAAPSSTR
jgi:hypothetical protein